MLGIFVLHVSIVYKKKLCQWQKLTFIEVFMKAKQACLSSTSKSLWVYIVIHTKGLLSQVIKRKSGSVKYVKICTTQVTIAQLCYPGFCHSTHEYDEYFPFSMIQCCPSWRPIEVSPWDFNWHPLNKAKHTAAWKRYSIAHTCVTKAPKEGRSCTSNALQHTSA